MVFIRNINKDRAGWRIYLPPSFIRELKWRPHDQILIFVDSIGRIVIDRITPEKYPDFFKVSPEEIYHE